MRLFLLSSFPSLNLADKPPVSFGEFRDRCADHLSERDLAELDAVCSHPPRGDSHFAREWASACAELHEWNTRRRTRRLHSESGTRTPAEQPPRYPSLRDDALAAWESHDPLRRENGLLLAQWNWLEGVRRTRPQSADELMAYGLQLRLLERRQVWVEAEGLRVFEEQTSLFMTPLLEELREPGIPA